MYYIYSIYCVLNCIDIYIYIYAVIYIICIVYKLQQYTGKQKLYLQIQSGKQKANGKRPSDTPWASRAPAARGWLAEPHHWVVSLILMLYSSMLKYAKAKIILYII